MTTLKQKIHNFIQSIPLDGINYPQLETCLNNLLKEWLQQKQGTHTTCDCTWEDCLNELLEELEGLKQTK